jgi:hypothetical protein
MISCEAKLAARVAQPLNRDFRRTNFPSPCSEHRRYDADKQTSLSGNQANRHRREIVSL